MACGLRPAAGGLTRREVLRTGAAGTAAAAMAAGGLSLLAGAADAASRTSRLPAAAGEEDYDFLMARVKFACDTRIVDTWNITPGGDRNLLEELARVVRCKVDLPDGCYCDSPYFGEERHFNAVVDFADAAELAKYPFLFMTSEGFFTLTPRQEANLKLYLQEGGFILMDDCIYNGADYFYQSAYKLLERLFGQGSVVRIPNAHEVFKNVYDLSAIGLPWVAGQNHGARGVYVGDRLAAFLSSTDIHCGWTDRTRKWYSRTDSTPHDYKEAIQMGINLIMYALSH
jgi:hypothetical protein